MSVRLSAADVEKLNSLNESTELKSHERERIAYLLGGRAGAATRIGGLSASELDALYLRFGYIAVLDADGGRGGDFAKNHARGAWAEGLLEAWTGSERFVPFGTSNSISPTAEGYDQVRRNHRDILLREGKRPDFLLMSTNAVEENPEVLAWQSRELTPEDAATLSDTAICAVEVKSSLCDFGVRQAYCSQNPRVKPISIILKDEEIPALTAWQSKTGVPIIIVQIFVDTVHVCSLNWFLAKIRSGEIRSYLEYKTKKPTYKLPLPTASRLIADIALPPGFSFNSPENGILNVEPPVWPQAFLPNLNLSKILAAYQQRTRSNQQ